jgi:hypothetical protein
MEDEAACGYSSEEDEPLFTPLSLPEGVLSAEELEISQDPEIAREVSPEKPHADDEGPPPKKQVGSFWVDRIRHFSVRSRTLAAMPGRCAW